MGKDSIYSDVREHPSVPELDPGRFTVKIKAHAYEEDVVRYPNHGCVACGFREWAAHHRGAPKYDRRCDQSDYAHRP